MVSARVQHSQHQKLIVNSNLMQMYTESLIRFGSTRSKLLTFLNWSRSICGLWSWLHQYIFCFSWTCRF